MLRMATSVSVSTSPEYLTIHEARQRLEARGCRVTRETVRRWAKTGKVRSLRTTTGGRFLICAEDLDAILVPVEVGGAA